MSPITIEPTAKAAPPPRKAFYRNLWIQVVIAVALAIVLGYVWPDTAVAMRPLGDAFIRLISMVIGIVMAIAAQLLPAGIFQIAFNGLIIGLAASGLYDIANMFSG